jgi:hypothetical protein
MSYSALDRRRIYLACRPIFAGNNALLRKPKKIRELLLMHLKSIQPLVQDFSIETVADIVKVLLERRIFQSDVKAKLEFPELFHSSPARDAQRATSENDAARSVAEALEEVASREDNSKSDDEEQEALEDAIQNSNNVQLVFDEDSTPKEQPLHNISLYPTFFHIVPNTPSFRRYSLFWKIAALSLCVNGNRQSWKIVRGTVLRPWS